MMRSSHSWLGLSSYFQGPTFCRHRKYLEVFSCLPYSQPQALVIRSPLICWQATMPYTAGIPRVTLVVAVVTGRAPTGSHSYALVNHPQHRWLWNWTLCTRNRVCGIKIRTYPIAEVRDFVLLLSKSQGSDCCHGSTPRLFQSQRNKTQSSPPLIISRNCCSEGTQLWGCIVTCITASWYQLPLFCKQ